jgi:UPF0271 protein
MIYRVDINCDLGEGGGTDEQLLHLVTSANIACGVHAGNAATMRRVVRWAMSLGVGIGAHPGLADAGGMGRTEQALTPAQARQTIAAQVASLGAIAASEGGRLQHVKPHGALYNMAARDEALAEAIAQSVASADPKLVLFALAGSRMERAGRAAGLAVAREAFLDRTYQADGSLTPRSRPDAFVHDPDAATARAIRMVKEHIVDSVDGRELAIEPDTLCVHGDNPKALELLGRLRQALAAAGIEVKPVGQP